MTGGSSSPISVDEALALVTSGIEPLPAENVDLECAHGRVLAQDLAARTTLPPFPASAMDGYAVRAADVNGEGSSPSHPNLSPARLRIIGEASAGHGFSGSVEARQAVRIFTGAPVPLNADTVVMQEHTRRTGDWVEIFQPARSGDFIRPEGSEFRSGDTLLLAGRKLAARDLALAASMNYAALPVRRAPTVAILATGDELAPPGSTPAPWQIISSTCYGLAAMVRNAGGTPKLLGVARDSLEDLHERLTEADGADVLLTIGGAAGGDYDLVHAALLAQGFNASFSKVAMQPGKSTLFGHIGRQPVLAAPGNPGASFICAFVFLYPLISALLGASTPTASPTMATLGADLPANTERQHYIRAVLTHDDRGGCVATPLRSQGRSQNMSFNQGNCLIVRPPFAPARKAGVLTPVLNIDF